MSDYRQILLSISVVLVGFMLTALISFWREKGSPERGAEFLSKRYLILSILPLISVLFLVLTDGIGMFYIFLAFVALGIALESFLGLIDKIISKSPDWIYLSRRFGKYTKLVPIPWYGFIGTILWLIAKSL